jgi:hypothetical protein
MVGVAANVDSKSIVILGHGLTLADDFEVAPGIILSPHAPALDVQRASAGCRHFNDYAAALNGHELPHSPCMSKMIAGVKISPQKDGMRFGCFTF